MRRRTPESSNVRVRHFPFVYKRLTMSYEWVCQMSAGTGLRVQRRAGRGFAEAPPHRVAARKSRQERRPSALVISQLLLPRSDQAPLASGSPSPSTCKGLSWGTQPGPARAGGPSCPHPHTAVRAHSTAGIFADGLGALRPWERAGTCPCFSNKLGGCPSKLQA